MKKMRKCGKCGASGILKRVVMKNGESHVAYFCKCGNQSSWLKKSLVKKSGIDIYALGVAANYSEVECEVIGCKNTGYEYHHIAPRYLFGDDAGRWPLVKLCKQHHKEWHDVVTPRMNNGD